MDRPQFGIKMDMVPERMQRVGNHIVHWCER